MTISSPITSTSLELEHLLTSLPDTPDRETIISELDVLRSIYGDQAISRWHPPSSVGASVSQTGSISSNTVRYGVTLSLLPPHDAISFQVLVTLPPSYPATSPPQLQLLSRYIGAFGVDADLFGSIIKTFMSVNGVEWNPGLVCVFDGLQSVLEIIVHWYEQQIESKKAGEALREQNHPSSQLMESPEIDSSTSIPASLNTQQVTLPEGVKLVEAEPIVDRKSAFVGRACRISTPEQVPLILAFLMEDRRIAKAAHPIISAWRCQVGNYNDDDGESAAGGRLAHLLQILDVLVVVTRYFGGTLLGADRFKHINQAARDALELGGFVETKSIPAGNRTKGGKQ
ncbi:ribosomal protein S5 domain 2-type protein [Russula earlei]|uniref:Ribosomal protein S5 domain 2-type protein n=1 Tax=Russula earlei TaxID=71964 RepID=A0ACC0URD5_9AGAM|nr:ribosomal protein S5 domain 2-type protein [Russula earlei]